MSSFFLGLLFLWMFLSLLGSVMAIDATRRMLRTKRFFKKLRETNNLTESEKNIITGYILESSKANNIAYLKALIESPVMWPYQMKMWIDIFRGQMSFAKVIRLQKEIQKIDRRRRKLKLKS